MDQYSDAVSDFVSHLVAGSRRRLLEFDLPEFQKRYGDRVARGGHRCGCLQDGERTVIWYPSGKASQRGVPLVSVFEFSRETVPLTRSERKLIARIPEVLEAVIADSVQNLERAQRLAVHLSLSDLVVARYIRRGNTSRNWTPALVLRLLKDLSYHRYEGKPATSGFVFTSQFDDYKRELRAEEIALERFEVPFRISTAFFDKPSSYRYVDGRNSWYVLDRDDVNGVVRLRQPERYSIIDRSIQTHAYPIVDAMPGRVWAAFSGRNSDVHVIQSGNVHLHWSKNRWHARQADVLVAYLRQAAISEDLAALLAAVLLTLSALRLGALILIVNDINVRPPVLRRIDESSIGSSVRATIVNRPLSELKVNHSVLGVLASDGLTTITRDGIVTGAGEIIDSSIDPEMGQQGVSGASGGQAALAASRFGLAAKVSQDGPISIFKDMKPLIKF